VTQVEFPTEASYRWLYLGAFLLGAILLGVYLLMSRRSAKN